MAVPHRAAVVRLFSDEASVLRLGTALAVERNEHRLARRYVPARPAQPAEVLTQAA